MRSRTLKSSYQNTSAQTQVPHHPTQEVYHCKAAMKMQKKKKCQSLPNHGTTIKSSRRKSLPKTHTKIKHIKSNLKSINTTISIPQEIEGMTIKIISHRNIITTKYPFHFIIKSSFTSLIPAIPALDRQIQN